MAENDGPITLTIDGETLEAAKRIAATALGAADFNNATAYVLCMAAAQLIADTSEPSDA